MTGNTSFDHRLVRYEEIHAIQQDDFIAFVNAGDIHGKCHILDCGSGYGAVTREILKATEQQRNNGLATLAIDLIDESPVQLERAKSELGPWHSTPGVTLDFINGTFPQDLPASCGNYEVVFCKMVLHEISKDQQLSFLVSAYDRLTAGGRLVIWDLCLSPEIALFYRSVVRMKDFLAGYETMVERRNFLTEGEMYALFANSPFGALELVKDISYRFDTQKRLIPEFGGDRARFDQWEEFIRKSARDLGPQVLSGIDYHDNGRSISFRVRKIIGLAKRVR